MALRKVALCHSGDPRKEGKEGREGYMAGREGGREEENAELASLPHHRHSGLAKWQRAVVVLDALQSVLLSRTELLQARVKVLRGRRGRRGGGVTPRGHKR